MRRQALIPAGQEARLMRQPPTETAPPHLLTPLRIASLPMSAFFRDRRCPSQMSLAGPQAASYLLCSWPEDQQWPSPLRSQTTLVSLGILMHRAVNCIHFIHDQLSSCTAQPGPSTQFWGLRLCPQRGLFESSDPPQTARRVY